MPDYRRFHVAGGTYFFTLKTERNAPIFGDESNVRLLGDVMRQIRKNWPVTITAIVILPDHIHSIWSLPQGDADYPKRWGWIKKEFSRTFLDQGGQEKGRSLSRIRNRRRGVWQRRYWEHTITNEDEFEAYFDYVHWNPVKHGYVSSPLDWPYSSFSRWVAAGVYSAQWGIENPAPESVLRIKDAGE